MLYCQENLPKCGWQIHVELSAIDEGSKASMLYSSDLPLPEYKLNENRN